MDDAAALSEIRRAAQAALEAWPEARAAVLFGSRARGTHRPDSDWDVAFIVRGDGDRLGTVPADVPFSVPGVRRRQYVNEVAIPEQLIGRKALCIGHVGRGIAVDGRILAGEWTKPKLRGTPFMETDKYWNSMATSLRMIEGAIEASARMGSSKNWRKHLGRADDFVACTADAAEHLAKAVMGRHGVDAYTIHSLDNLAGQARKAGHFALAEEVLRMNGSTKQDHVARYNGATKESLAHAISRLPVVLELMRKELAELPAGFLDLQEGTELVEAAMEVFRDGAATLRAAVERDGAGMEPPEPYGWLKPLVEFREALAAKLDGTVDSLSNDRNSSTIDDWQPPAPSPLDDPTDPFKG
ncbi:MAG: nucleotidyltransferase domain-containing protein [Boseongicola sp. SB0677_bin_26]|nr:nucleotidyltransferase domain-containing protein [Boseongicola sp. SB0665_bin_10]MYG26043.1 nucleotidyltransferase domain-containing protein [Boseongicola sp. SB0677_bin_26]